MDLSLMPACVYLLSPDPMGYLHLSTVGKDQTTLFSLCRK